MYDSIRGFVDLVSPHLGGKGGKKTDKKMIQILIDIIIF
jgi:hypothetical protein